ncbi:MAG: nucleotidyltransferase domain-containing protein [Chloroflexi bacterium]|nr:nucleotidyltransferase domain-containing protein [Chloroflexota bacterium]
MEQLTPFKAVQLLSERLPALQQLFASDKRVLSVWLFGSLSDGYTSQRSDVDLAVLFDCALDYREEADFDFQVRETLGADSVDVVCLNRASLLLRFRAISGQLIYERDYTQVSDFIEQTLSEYHDFAPRRAAMLRDYFRE